MFFSRIREVFIRHRSDDGWLRSMLNFSTPLLVPACLIGIWSLSSLRGWVSPDILPLPEDVYLALVNLFETGVLQSNAESSFIRLFWGVLTGTVLGIVLGVSMGRYLSAEEYLLPTFKIFNLVPPLGWIPVLTLLMGIDDSMKILIIAKAVMTPITLNTLQGMKSVSSKYHEVASIHQFSPLRKVRLLYLPSLLPYIFTGIRYGFSNAWMALVAVELLASSEGLGYLLSEGRQLFQLDVVLAMVVVIGVSGWLTDKLLGHIEARLQRVGSN